MILFATFAVTIYFSMETVFDHNITDDEWKWVNGSSKDKYLLLAKLDPITAFRDIAYLYWLRGDKELAKKYAKKLPPLKENDFWRILAH